MLTMNCAAIMFDQSVVIFLAVLIIANGSASLAGVIRSLDSQQESQAAICDKHKVECDPGWSCQAGFLLFPIAPAENRMNCDDDASDTSGSTAAATPKNCRPKKQQVSSMEVFCVRNGHLAELGLYSGRLQYDLKFLSALHQQRHRRAICIQFCSNDSDCSSADEVCISNGCGNVCAKKV